MRMIKCCAALFLCVALTLAFAACGGKTAQTADDSLQARFAALYETDALSEIMEDPEAHADEIAAYGLDDFAQTFADTDAFRSYTVEISVQNTNAFAVELLNVQMETQQQGKNGVYFSALSKTAAIGLPAQYTGDEAMYYYVIANALLSKDDVLRTLGEMGISCVYMKGSEAPDMDAQIDPSLLFSGVILYEG